MDQKSKLPPQHQDRRSGAGVGMSPVPKSEDHKHHGSGKLSGKAAIIMGGTAGRPVAIAFARREPM